MIRFKTLLPSVLAALALSSVAAQAATEHVIVTVDVQAAVGNYYKTQAFYQELQAANEEAKLKGQAMQEEKIALLNEVKDLSEQAKSDILTEEAKNDARADAQKKFEEAREKEREIAQFVEQTRRQFAQREQQQLNIFTNEVGEVILEIAKARGVTLLLDSSRGNGSVLYGDESYDITEEVVQKINVGAPAAEQAPAEAAK